MEHDLKCWPEYFQAVRRGRKPFEIRKEDDRRFGVDDILNLREWEPLSSSFTGEIERVRVTYVMRGGPWLSDGYAAMGIKPESPPRPRVSLGTCPRCGRELDNLSPGISVVAGGSICTPCLNPGETEIARAKGISS